MIGNTHEEVKTLVQLLFTSYGSLVVDIEITSKLTGRSVHSLRRDLVKSRGIPTSKMGMGTGSDPVKYSIYDIATYTVNKKTKTYNI